MLVVMKWYGRPTPSALTCIMKTACCHGWCEDVRNVPAVVDPSWLLKKIDGMHVVLKMLLLYSLYISILFFSYGTTQLSLDALLLSIL